MKNRCKDFSCQYKIDEVLVNLFGKEFSSYIEVNFEKDKRVHALFPSHISLEKTLEQLQVYTQKKIIPGSTLLFLDEIQECPDAIRYLRYFKEEMPELHVIAAGSLLEFSLEKLGVAVGRVDYLFLYPLSFMEFLTANHENILKIIPWIYLEGPARLDKRQEDSCCLPAVLISYKKPVLSPKVRGLTARSATLLSNLAQAFFV